MFQPPLAHETINVVPLTFHHDRSPWTSYIFLFIFFMTGSRMPEYIRKTIVGRLVSHEGLEFHLRSKTGVYKRVYRLA